MINFKCIGLAKHQGETWSGTITNATFSTSCIEAEATARDSYFQIIIGHYKYGGYLCVPNFGIGLEVPDFNDYFWIYEKIMHNHQELNKVDVMSIISAASELAIIANL